MGMIDASLGRYVANHPELRPAPLFDANPWGPDFATLLYRRMGDRYAALDHEGAFSDAYDLAKSLRSGGPAPHGLPSRESALIVINGIMADCRPLVSI